MLRGLPAHLCSSVCRHVFCGLQVTSTSCLHRSGVFSSCCLALDSSSSFPCPAFRAIAKSVAWYLLSYSGHILLSSRAQNTDIFEERLFYQIQEARKRIRILSLFYLQHNKVLFINSET
ncbi:hypothetical protein STEG23_002094 [Scotinomys teguina]